MLPVPCRAGVQRQQRPVVVHHRPVGVPEQQHLRAALLRGVHSRHRRAFHVPGVAVQHQYPHAAQLYEPLLLVIAAPVAVPRHALHGKPRKLPPQRLQIPLAVPQMQHIVRLYPFHRPHHIVHVPVAVRHHQHLHTLSPPYFLAPIRPKRPRFFPRLSFRASDRCHWRGNPSPLCFMRLLYHNARRYGIIRRLFRLPGFAGREKRR